MDKPGNSVTSKKQASSEASPVAFADVFWLTAFSCLGSLNEVLFPANSGTAAQNEQEITVLCGGLKHYLSPWGKPQAGGERRPLAAQDGPT